TIDTVNLHFVHDKPLNNCVIIGWTGTHSTLKYLEPLIPVLKVLENTYKYEFRVICNKEPEFKLESLKFIKWNKATEIEDLSKFDIGLMPLEDDIWAKGKCGFKALQYMALGIPPVVSPVGVNVDIVEQGVTGFLCKSEEEWYKALELLIKDTDARNTIGGKARKRVENSYSVNSNKENFIMLFQ
ncbi:MAG TPA: glycosyltransferase, partial [Cytophagaceae bacterium]